MTKYADLFAALCAPFAPNEVKQRQAPGGRMMLSYITARTAMNRLDEVVGPENWWDEYIPGNDSVMCKLTIRLPDGTALTKMDAGGYAGMQDSGDDDKSGFSDAFKRACAKWGIARYLYKDGVPSYAGDAAPPPEPAQRPQQAPQHASGPAAPRQEPPRSSGPQQGQQPPQQRQEGGNGFGSAPRSGRALFAWTKEQEQRHDVGLLKYLNNWAKLQDFPGRMIDWDEEQVRLAHAEAVRKLQSVSPGARDEEAAHLARQRDNLRAAIGGLLQDRGMERADRHDYDRVLNELSGLPLVGGEVIHSIDDCSDSALLGRYIAACDDLRRTEANV